MKNKHFTKIFLIFILLFLLLASVTLIGFINNQSINTRFFTDISSFNKLVGYEKNENNLPTDKYLNDIVPESSYTKEIEYKGKTYRIYAYVFHDTNSAISYFNKYTGKKAVSDFDFSMSTNYLSASHFVAFNEKCLYRVEGGNFKSFIEAVNFINESFPLDKKTVKEKSES